MQLVIVERQLDKPRTFREVQAIEDASMWCFDLHGVRAIHSYFSKDRLRMICVYEAPDAEAVRQANRKAGLPFERVWSADRFAVDADEPDGV